MSDTAYKLYRVQSSLPLTLYPEWGVTDVILGQTNVTRGNHSWDSSQKVGPWYYLDIFKGWVNTDDVPSGTVKILPPSYPYGGASKDTYESVMAEENERTEAYDRMNTHIGLSDVDENARLNFGDTEGDTGVSQISEYSMPSDADSWHESQYNNYGSGNQTLPTPAQNSSFPSNDPTLEDLSLGQLPSDERSLFGREVYFDKGNGPETSRYVQGNMNSKPRPNIAQGSEKHPTGNMNKSYRPNVPQGKGSGIPNYNLNTRTIKLKPRPSNEGKVYQPYFDQRYGSSQFIENINTPHLTTPNDYAVFGSTIQTIKRNLNIFDRGDMNKVFTQFNRYRLPIPDQHLPRTVPYVFITRPNISFYKSNGNLEDQFYKDSLFNTVNDKFPEVIRNLELKYNSNHQFNTILGSMTRSFEVSDEVIKTVDDGETYTGWKMVYGRNTNESNTASQIGIQYTDDAQLRIYHTHKVWLEYINKVYRGEFSPKRDMILEKTIDYSVAIYYIVCAADGETILYWSKYYGVFPINTPGSKHSWTYGNTQVNQEFTVNYAYSLKVEMEPSILAEFNTHSKLPFRYRKLYDRTIQTNSPTFVNAPFAEKSNDQSGRTVYKLRFRN